MLRELLPIRALYPYEHRAFIEDLIKLETALPSIIRLWLFLEHLARWPLRAVNWELSRLTVAGWHLGSCLKLIEAWLWWSRIVVSVVTDADWQRDLSCLILKVVAHYETHVRSGSLWRPSVATVSDTCARIAVKWLIKQMSALLRQLPYGPILQGLAKWNGASSSLIYIISH